MIAITISDVHPDPLGRDRENNHNSKLNQEWIEITNIGNEDFKIKGKVLVDRTATNQRRHAIVFDPLGKPDYALPVGVTLRVYTGNSDDANDPPAPTPTGTWRYFLCYNAYIWNNTGDTAEIYASEADYNAGNAPIAKRTF